MREAIRRLEELGPLPAEHDEAVSDELWEELEGLIDGIEKPVSRAESLVLCRLFGPDSGYGLNWSILHLVESTEAWPVAECLSGSGPWVDRLKARVSNARQQI